MEMQRAENMRLSVECSGCRVSDFLDKKRIGKQKVVVDKEEFDVMFWECNVCGKKMVGQIDNAESRKKFYECMSMIRNVVAKKRKGKFQTESQQRKSKETRRQLAEMRKVLMDVYGKEVERELNA